MFNARLSECFKIVAGSNPIDVGSGLDGDWISLRNYQKVAFLISLGAVASGSAITVEQAKSTDGFGAKALAFTSKNLKVNGNVGASDALVETTPSGTNTHTPANANGQLVVLEFNASELDKNNGFDCVRVRIASDSGTIANVTALLGGSRYQGDSAPTAIEDLDS
jgi:hypothetical protein